MARRKNKIILFVVLAGAAILFWKQISSAIQSGIAAIKSKTS